MIININLLPNELKEEINQAKKNASSLDYLKKSAFLLVAMLFLFGAFYFVFRQSLNEQQQKQVIAQKEIEKFGNLEEISQKIVNKTNKIKKIEAQNNIWSKLLSEIKQITPTTIKIVSLKLDSGTRVRQTINGIATNKKEVADYRDALEKSPFFEFVDIDSTQIRDDGYESFTFSFNLSEGSLK